MNRHLHNTLSALLVSGSLLVAGLIAAAPLLPPDTGQAAFGDGSATFTSPVPGAAAVANALGQVADQTLHTESSRPGSSSPRYRRQTLVMPYLSFVPRG